MVKDHKDRMSDFAYRMMTVAFILADLVYPSVDRRTKGFSLSEGLTVVDYGCGPGRYTRRFAKIVGQRGLVYAVDIHELAIEHVKRMMRKRGFNNIKPVLAEGYYTDIPDDAAEVVLALDMFFGVSEPDKFLQELHRIAKPDGFLIIDDGHQSRKTTLHKIMQSGL
ncbi:MAG: methyltransferase domain-containing protein [Anaerolineales bacterium]|jgi:ubiquinone/menaquinone biosynthesis C-methylase UbiE